MQHNCNVFRTIMCSIVFMLLGMDDDTSLLLLRTSFLDAMCQLRGHKHCLRKHFADCVDVCKRSAFVSVLGRHYSIDWCLDGHAENATRDACFCCDDTLDEDLRKTKPSCPLLGHEICLNEGNFANCLSASKRNVNPDGLSRPHPVSWCLIGTLVCDASGRQCFCCDQLLPFEGDEESPPPAKVRGKL